MLATLFTSAQGPDVGVIRLHLSKDEPTVIQAFPDRGNDSRRGLGFARFQGTHGENMHIIAALSWVKHGLPPVNVLVRMAVF